MLANAEPDENGYLPTPYEMGGEGELVAALGAAGFRGAAEERVVERFWFRDADEAIHAAMEGSPIGHSLREEGPEVERRVLAEVRANLAPWTTRSGVIMPAEAVVVNAVR